VQNEFIQSDLNRRVALPLRHAAEDTVAQIHDDFVATPLNQNYLLPARTVVEVGGSIVNQRLLAGRRALTGNRLDWLFGGPAILLLRLRSRAMAPAAGTAAETTRPTPSRMPRPAPARGSRTTASAR